MASLYSPEQKQEAYNRLSAEDKKFWAESAWIPGTDVGLPGTIIKNPDYKPKEKT